MSVPQTAGWSAGSTVFGEFRVERELGRGGFGRVELVESLRSGERYAVKVIDALDDSAQSRFLLEVQRWINLPAHPHTAGCFFIRGAGGQVAVFAEYVAGGSLAEWIADRRLYEQPGEAPLARVLRIAAEAAWGLDAAHQLGLLHLDVKPGNVLLTEEGRAKVADFGLAAAREFSAEESLQLAAILDYITDVGLEGPRRELMKSSLREHMFGAGAAEEVTAAGGEGLTPAYASPEQARGERLTRASDVWSWAATVLEMFAGARTWPRGIDAGLALEQITQPGYATRGLAMAPEVAAVLRDCLRDDPAARPASLRDVAGELAELSARLCGTRLAGDALPAAAPPGATVGPEQSKMWHDPARWLHYAYATAGLDPRESARFWPDRLGSFKARALADLRALGEARRVLSAVPPTEETTDALGRLMTEIAELHMALGDVQAALPEYEAARLAFASLEAGAEGEAVVLTRTAIALRELGRTAESLAASGRAIELIRSLPEPDPSMLATALLAEANTTTDAPDRRERFEEASALFESAGDQEGHMRTLLSLATTLEAADDHAAAEPIWEQAGVLLDGLAGGRLDLQRVRATMRLNRATLASSPADERDHAEAAAEILRPLVVEHGEFRATGDLGVALFRSGRAHEALGRPQEAVARYAESRAHLEHAVVRDGRNDLADELAESADHEATLLRALGDLEGALEVARRAVTLWERLTALEGTEAWAAQIATARTKFAGTLSLAGHRAEAAEQLAAAFAVLEEHQAAIGEAVHRRLLGGAHLERGSLHRSADDPASAIVDAQEAAALAGDDLRLRANALMNMSNALNDVGDDARAFEAALAGIETLHSIEDGDPAVKPEIAAAYQNLVGKLVKDGDYEAAIETARTGLTVFRELLSEGRTDLAGEYGRLLGAYGFALERTQDIAGAIEATAASLDAYATAPGVPQETRQMIREGLEPRLERLRALERSGPGELGALLDETRGTVESATSMSRQGMSAEASMLLEEAVGRLTFLLGRFPSDDVRRDLGHAASVLGMVAFAAARPRVAQRALGLAIDSFGFLVEQSGERDRVDDLGRSYGALASLLAYDGDSEGATDADAVIDEMYERLRRVDRRKARTWRTKTREIVRAARGGG